MILPCLDRQQGLALWAMLRQLVAELAPLDVELDVHLFHRARTEDDDVRHPPIHVTMRLPIEDVELDAVDVLAKRVVTDAQLAGYGIDEIRAGVVVGQRLERHVLLSWRAG